MTLTAHPYDEGTDGAEWDDFLDRRSRNGTFLHSRRFFRHNPANARDDRSLIFRDGGRIVGVLPAALLTDADGSRTLHSHPRSTYGGFVLAASANLRQVLAMVDATVAHARDLRAARVVVRNPFRIFHLAPSDDADYALWLRGFALHARELELAMVLEGLTEETVLASFDPKSRNQARKAQRAGVTVTESADFAAFWEILEANLRARHDVRPTHALPDFLRLRESVGADAVRLFAAEHEGRMVAGMVVFVANRQALHAQYIASRADASHLCPVNALVHRVAVWGAAQGHRYLNLGLSTEEAGRTVNAGLVAFKEGFGAHGLLRETMMLSLPT